jgi:hypothetical protein
MRAAVMSQPFLGIGFLLASIVRLIPELISGAMTLD